jgi:hypothetical protein
MSRRWIVFTVLWPLLVLGLGLYAPRILRQSHFDRPASEGVTSKPSEPESAVTAYWHAEDQSQSAVEKLEATAVFRGRISDRMWGEWRKQYHRCKERSIEGKAKLDDNRWKVMTTAWSVSDDESPVKVTYIVTKERNAWVVDEARLQCPKCKGEKRVACWSCDGAGKKKDDYSVYSGWTYKTCEECNGTGKAQCSQCEGKGYLTLDPGDNPFLRPSWKFPW